MSAPIATKVELQEPFFYHRLAAGTRYRESAEPSNNAMASGVDPYEQQLLAVFESCCEPDNNLDSKGLARLCDKLQLEEHTPQLLERLLGADRVTFSQFRDALLAILAGAGHRSVDDQSPEREVRPKFVYGEKKYGRRSRPSESDDQEVSGGSDSDCCPHDPTTPMQKSEESTPRKRKQSPEVDHGGCWRRDLSEEEESVRATWDKLGATHEGYLGRQQLRLVCKAAGIVEGAAEELFQRLGIDQEGRISFEQFLHLFRSGLATNHQSQQHQEDQQQQQRSLTFHAEEPSSKFVSLDSSGLLSSDQLLSLWESGGVVGAGRLLHDLGLTSRRPIGLSELSSALEEEARALVEETPSSSAQPLTSVLHASLVIHQTENKCLKSALEQILAERDKLRQDVIEANERASLLAQEVDDRHARLELTTKQQARLQEQRHSEEVRALQDQLSMDREQLANLSTGLELRLGQMQTEEAKLRADLEKINKQCENLEKENSSLKEQLFRSEEVKGQLQRKVESLPQLELRLSELESENADFDAHTVLPLKAKLETLTRENTALRDANDELTLKLEQTQTNKKCTESESPRGVRRGRSSEDNSSDDDSPPLGKLRRRSLAGTDLAETERLEKRIADLERQLALCQEHLKEPSGDQEQQKPAINLSQVFQQMRAEILQEVLEDPDTLRSSQVKTLKTRCDDLTQLQKTMEAEFEMQLYHTKHERDLEVNQLKQQLNNAPNQHNKDENLSQEIERLLSAKQAWQNGNQQTTTTLPQVSKLTERVAELEASLELMREEYERCEDYWQGKLEEERGLFEQEQAVTDDRFTQLETKIQEYEELLCQEQSSSNAGGRLSPIQESFALEKQVTDLEEECSALNDQLETLRNEFSWSQQKLVEAELKCRSAATQQLDVAVQTEPKQRSVSLLAGFSLLGRDKQTQITSSLEEVENKRLHRSPDLLCDFPPKAGSGILIREQSCRVQLNVMQTLSSRLQQQEQRGRRLEALLAQHQIYTERLVHQHRNEINTLQAALHASQARLQQQYHAFEEQAQKLASNDVLVKDLYVENALLLARVDSLEKSCVH